MAQVLFWTGLLSHLAAVTFCTLWPIRSQLHRLQYFRGWLRLYSIAESNLDVWILCVTTSTLLPILLLQGRPAPAYGAPRLPAYTTLKRLMKTICGVSLLLLLGKAIAVAVLSEGVLLPFGHGAVGLLYLYSSIVVSGVAVLLEQQTAVTILNRWRRLPLQQWGVQEPLLGAKATDSTTADTSSETQAATVAALLRLSAPDTPLLLLASSAGVVAALGQACIPYYIGKIIDLASLEPDWAAFKVATIKLVFVSLACALFTGIRGGLFTIGMARLNVRLRKRLFHSLLHQDIEFFDTTKTGDITSRLSADTTTVSDQICLNVNVMLRSLTQAMMVLAFMFFASWRLTVLTFIVLPAILLITKVYGSYYRKLAKKVQTELAEANSVAEEVLGSMTTVKAHAAELGAATAYSKRLAKFFTLQRKEAFAYAAYMLTATFLPNLATAIVLFYGGVLVLQHEQTQGSLISYMFYQQSLSSALQALGDVFSSLTAAVGAADKVLELIQRKSNMPSSGTLMPPNFQGELDFENVTFAYPSRPGVRVLNGLTLHIKPGEVVALVGPSGGGKSSIVKLVERFYLPSTGRVLLDRRDLADFDQKWLKQRMAIVSQEPILFGRSIRLNILYGLTSEDGVPADEVPTEADVIAAAQLANAHSFITTLPDGYNTDCGEKGLLLSGGQKQRICIARALVRRPKILLLDEATSALDADSEAVVQEALDRLMQMTTTLVIAHRLSTIQSASRICVISNGQVLESGTHDELLEMGGQYSTLVSRQIQRGASSASLSGLPRGASSSSLLSAG